MRRSRSAAFTLVELMVSTAVLSLIILLLVSITSQTSNTWRYTSGKTEQFRGARDAFESVTRRVGQATLNTYYDYYNSADEPRTTANAANFVPRSYGRQSELRFIAGSMDRSNTYNGASVPALAADSARPRPTHGIFFQAPLGLVEDDAKHGGLPSLLNSWGYYVEFDSDQRARPPFLKTATDIAPLRYRYRLMEFMQPAEAMSTYTKLTGPPNAWFESAVNDANTTAVHALAENVIALVLQPALSPKDEKELKSPPKVEGTALAPSYFYDSTKKNSDPALNPRHQLPPTVRVTMVALDELSAQRLADGKTPPDFGLPDLFVTNQSGSAEKYAADLATLEAKLAERRVNYRVFTTNVAIQAAKWSKK